MKHNPNQPQRAAQPLEDLAAEAIRELTERGEWKELPGKGKPLKLVGDLADAPTMAGKLRKDANFSTPWNDLGQEIDHGFNDAKQMIARAHRFYRVAQREGITVKAESEWQNALSNLEKQLAAMNSKILKYNLIIPRQMPQLHRPRYRIERVLEELGITSAENKNE
jgi:hypothetical protein